MSMSNVPGSNRCSAGRHSDSAGVLSFSGVHAGSPEWIWSLYAGALVLAISVVVLGVGLIRAHDKR